MRVRLPGNTFSADIAFLGPASRSEGDGLTAFRFNRLSQEALGMLSAFLCSEHSAQSARLDRLFSRRDDTIEFDAADGYLAQNLAAAIEALLRHYLEESGTDLFLYRRRCPVPVRLGPAKVMDKGGAKVITAVLPGAQNEALDERREHILFFSSPLAVSWFTARVKRADADHIDVAMPTRLLQTGFRTSRRVQLEGAHRMRVTIEDPFLCGERICGQILEVGGNGFSLQLDGNDTHLFPGQSLDRVRVDLTLGSVAMECVLRICKPAEDAGALLAGFEIVGFASPEDHDRWMRCLIPHLFPAVRIGDRHNVLSAWARLEESGYLELISESERDRLRVPFFEDWTRHATDNGGMARFLLCHQNDAPIGITAVNRVYPKTCLVHSGGIDKIAQGNGNVLKLYAASFLFAHTAGDYCLSFFDASKTTNVVLFQQFIRLYAGRQDNVFDGLTVYKWEAQATSALPHVRDKSDLEVVSATPELLRFLWKHQQQALSPLELDAYGWSVDNGAMRQFADNCARKGYERRRQVFFALAHNTPTAALIAESGSEGMNVFSLLNSCSVVSFDSAVPPTTETLRMLLARAVDFYNGAGKAAFLFLGTSGAEETSNLQELGFNYVAQGWRWLAASRVIPAYISYLEDLAIIRGAGKEKWQARLIGNAVAVKEGAA